MIKYKRIGYKGIPNFASSRQDAFKDLPKCFREEATLPKVVMKDGSSRTTVAAMTINGVAAKMTSHCGGKSDKLRSAVDAAIVRLFSALDMAASVNGPLKSANTLGYVMEPYSSFGSLIANGSHLEHLHMYEAGSASLSKLPTMDFHVDSGLLVAMTSGFYSSSSPSVSSSSPFRGLLLELASGMRVQVGIQSEAALVVMVGSAAAGWLRPVLGAPLRPAPHSLLAGLSPSDPLETRSWFGKMYLPPQDALLPATASNGIPMTYGRYRQSELASQGERPSELQLPAGCGGKPEESLPPAGYGGYTSLASNDLCQINGGGTGVYCWMQCMSVADLPCGTAAVCVDTVTGNQVPGNDHCPTGTADCELQCLSTQIGNSTFDGYCYGLALPLFHSHLLF